VCTSSKVAGLLTCPEIQKSLVPELRGRPKLANQDPPLSTYRKKDESTQLHDKFKIKKKKFFLPSKNGRSNGDSFDVGNSGRAAEKTDISREWRLQSRLSLLAFNRFNQTGFLTTNIGTSTTVNVNIKIKTRSTGILTNQTSSISFVDGFLEMVGFLVKFTTNIDIS
jgi:hypothetical protein